MINESVMRCCATCLPTSCSITPSYANCLFKDVAVEESPEGTSPPDRLCRYYCVKNHPLDKEGD